MSDTWIADNEDDTLLGCRRRRSDKPQWSSNGGVVGETNYYNRDSGKMAPRSFEHQIYISMSRTGHQLAFLSRGLISCFISRLDGISNFCAIYSFTGILFTLYVGMMIKHQPIFIKGINEENQELAKESAFGAMGMFIFLFTSSVIYLCLQRNRNSDQVILSQGYMRPGSASGMKLSDYQVELPHSSSGGGVQSSSHSEDEDDEFAPVLLS